MVGSETMREKGDSRGAVRAIAGVLHADLGCVRGSWADPNYR